MSEARKALIVDDNPTNRILARAMLTKMGWNSDEADCGAAALKQVQTCRYALILLDISMPGLSGEETCAALRALPEGDKLRIIAYTAHAFPEERQKILAAGFDDILIKPINLQTMAAVING